MMYFYAMLAEISKTQNILTKLEDLTYSAISRKCSMIKIELEKFIDRRFYSIMSKISGLQDLRSAS